MVICFNLIIPGLGSDITSEIFSFIDHHYFPILRFVSKEWNESLKSKIKIRQPYAFLHFVEKNKNLIQWIVENGCKLNLSFQDAIESIEDDVRILEKLMPIHNWTKDEEKELYWFQLLIQTENMPVLEWAIDRFDVFTNNSKKSSKNNNDDSDDSDEDSDDEDNDNNNDNDNNYYTDYDSDDSEIESGDEYYRVEKEKKLFECAAEIGKLNVMKLLKKKGFHFGSNTSFEAMKNGNLENMKWLYENKCKFKDCGLIGAIKANKLENLEWLKEIGMNFSKENHKCLFGKAAKIGNLEIMKFLKNNGVRFRTSTFSNAVINGNIENMEWLYENGCEINCDTYKECIMNNNLELLKSIKNRGCKFDSEVFEIAAIKGNLEIMKWLRDNGCPWNNKVMVNAVKNSNIENIKWLKDNGCPYNDNIFNGLTLTKNLKVLRFLIENEFECKDTFKPCQINSKHMDFSVDKNENNESISFKINLKNIDPDDLNWYLEYYKNNFNFDCKINLKKRKYLKE